MKRLSKGQTLRDYAKYEKERAKYERAEKRIWNILKKIINKYEKVGIKSSLIKKRLSNHFNISYRHINLWLSHKRKVPTKYWSRIKKYWEAIKYYRKKENLEKDTLGKVRYRKHWRFFDIYFNIGGKLLTPQMFYDFIDKYDIDIMNILPKISMEAKISEEKWARFRDDFIDNELIKIRFLGKHYKLIVLIFKIIVRRGDKTETVPVSNMFTIMSLRRFFADQQVKKKIEDNVTNMLNKIIGSSIKVEDIYLKEAIIRFDSTIWENRKELWLL